VDTSRQYVVWDWPVRLIHWSLVLGIATMWWTGEEGLMEIHSKVGYGLLVLVSTRLVWGFIGSYHARFSSFLGGFGRITAYLRDPEPAVGHNPLGGWSTLVLLLLVLVQALTGLCASDDIIFDGPLAYWAGEYSAPLTEWHEINWGLLQGFIALHLAAIVFYQWKKQQPLVQAMLRGKAPGKVSEHPPKPLWWAVLIAALAGLALYAVVTFAPEAPSYYY
jgi:cytochrome b